jgi:hypothetical protein
MQPPYQPFLHSLAEEFIVIFVTTPHLKASMQRQLLLLFILAANGFLPGGSVNTVRHNKQITHITPK